MATAVANKRKMYLTTAAVLAVGIAAYGLGRVYPPQGPSAGTVAPAQRYVSAQVTDADARLASAGACRDCRQPDGVRQFRFERQRLPRRRVQGRHRCASGEQRR